MTTMTRKACPQCRMVGADNSGDNFRYWREKDLWKCFSCDYIEGSTAVMERPINDRPQEPMADSLITGGYFRELKDRGISDDTCIKYNYQVIDIGENGQTEIHIENYRDKNTKLFTSQKLRYPNKDFPWNNYSDNIELFGLHTCLDYNKSIVVTEGAIDAMSVYEATGMQACSLRGGSKSARKDIMDNKTELLKYNEVIFWFDRDTSGQEALQSVINLIPRARAIDLDKMPQTTIYYKDANDILKSGEVLFIKKCLEKPVPEGILFSSGLDKARLLKPRTVGLELPFPVLNKKIRGLRQGKFIVIGAGSNIGKSPVLRKIGFHLYNKYPDLKIANLYLEEEENFAEHSFIAMKHRIPVEDFVEAPLKYISEEQFDQDLADMKKDDRLMFSDVKYDMNGDHLLKILEYLAVEKGFQVALLDHISLIISASATREGERRDIDVLMNKIKSLCNRTKLTIIAASHLSNPQQGKDWEEGREVLQRDFRGSGSLRQIPDILIGVERNLRDAATRDRSILRLVKNRGYGSDLGVCDTLYYTSATGWLGTTEELFGEQNEDDF